MQLRYAKDEVVLILLKNLSHTTSATKWDQYVSSRKKQVFPYSKDVLHILGANNWEKVTDILKHEWNNHDLLKDVATMKEKKELLSVAIRKLLIRKQVEPFEEHLTSARTYNEFRKDNKELDLPHYQSIIGAYGSWNEFKEELGLETNSLGRQQKYTDEELIEILKEHKDYLTDAKTWNEHAEKHNLPSIKYMRSRIPLEVIQQYTTYGKWYDYSIPYLLEIINEHKEAFTKGKNYWEEYAVKNQLPHYYTIVDKIGKVNTKRITNGENLTVEDIESNPF